MPLSRPSPREHIHSREIRCRGYRRADGLWDIEAVLEDTKTYSFANHDRGGIVSGEPIHRMYIRLTVDDSLVVRAAEASTEAAPFSLCGDIAPAFADLVGLGIGPGWRKAVLQRMGGVHGCTHLTDLLTGEVTQTVMQTVGPARSRRQTAPRSGAKPAVIDTCHALASTGPVVAREWPGFYTGPKATEGQRRPSCGLATCRAKVDGGSGRRAINAHPVDANEAQDCLARAEDLHREDRWVARWPPARADTLHRAAFRRRLKPQRARRRVALHQLAPKQPPEHADLRLADSQHHGARRV